MYVPSELFYVPLFEMKPLEYSKRPECKVFLVRSTIQPYINVSYWWDKEGQTELAKLYKDIPAYDEINWHGGFVNGRPMINPSVPVFTCAGRKRPSILYRVVHEEQPHYGMKARGYGLVDVTPLLFQVLVTKHLNWRCRHPSPFMSTTNSYRKVQQIIKTLHRHGKTGLRIVIFRSSGTGWDHKAQRLFHVPRLGRNLRVSDFKILPYMQAEYLLESHIPPESIMKIISVEDVYYEQESKKRKLVEDGSAQTENMRKSTRRSTQFRRET
ncbi:hypothetical protein F5Y12DRAFT_791496 [Xylaria sp. FL1777]|nr:hypothetical protein F5Y12DRAFT_791496 [Xylaria sp. FL1777]